MAARLSRAQLQGATVTYRVDWVLGTDRLLGRCWCGARRQAEDPIELWGWLTDHPHSHPPGHPHDDDDPSSPRPPAPAEPVQHGARRRVPVSARS